MKKIIASVMALTLLCSLLAGCGSAPADKDGATVPPGSPIIDPSMTPDVEDGVVDDRDGFIEEEGDRIGGDTAGKTAGDAAGDTIGDDAGIIGGTADSGSVSSGNTGAASASPSPSADTQR